MCSRYVCMYAYNYYRFANQLIMTENRKVNFRLGKPSSQKKVSYQPIDKVEEDSVHDGDKVLYPLDDLFQEFIKQEQVMWKKTQGVHIPLEGKAAYQIVFNYYMRNSYS